MAAATLQQALQALYHHPDAEARAAANRWLEEFQQTVEAWSITDAVLHDPNGSMEAQYFCAQTLRTKIQRDYEELPPGAPTSLRDSLLSHLVNFRQGPQAVRTQLCLAMAALAVHMPASDWTTADGGGVVKWLAAQLGSQPDAVPGLLELLAEVPQEAGSYKVAVRPERRRQYTAELVASVRDVFGLLASIWQSAVSDAHLREQVLLAFTAWLRLSPGIPAEELARSPLVLGALDTLESWEVFEAAVDTICELIRYTMSGGPGGVLGHMALITVLVPRVMALRPRFQAAVQAAIQEEAGKEIDVEEEESSRAMARLFAEMGEAYVELVASGSQDGLAVAQALLEVASHPDHGIAATTFRFWHKLSKALTSKARFEQAVSAAGDAVVAAEKERRLHLFRPLFQMLVGLVSGRVRYPAGFETWRRDERADFKYTRNAVADVLLDVSDVLGGEALLSMLAQPLFNPPANQRDWRDAEAALYCIRAIGRAIPGTEVQVLPRLFSYLPSLPPQPQLLYTAALTIAAYADWIATTPSVLSLLPPLLTMLTSGLAGPDETAAAASLALKHICDTCAVHLAGSGMVDGLLEVYRRALGAETSTSGPEFHLSDEDVLQIVEGLCLLVSALPSERLPQALTALCLPIISPLQQLLTFARGDEGPNAPTTRQFLVHIDRLADVFRRVAVPAAVAEALQLLWPLIHALFEVKGGDPRLMERLCRACKHAVRGAGRDMMAMLPDVLQEVQQQFRLHHQPCMLYVASEAIKTFGSDPALAELLGSTINTLISEATGMLREIQDFTTNPDVADDCFLLASRCLRYCPHLVAPTPLLGQLLDCALTGITVQHREACNSILSFLEAVVGLGLAEDSIRFRSAIEAAILQRGPALTRILLAAVGGALPESRLDDIADLLGVLARMCGQRLVQWSQEALALVPTSAVTDVEKAAFLQTLATAGGADRRTQLILAVDEFSDVCRRNKRSLDAVQAALQALRVK